MILPIYAYGQPVLRKEAEDITKDYEGLEKLISDMWETMYNAGGIGLAAPQIGLGIRIFLVDTAQIKDEDKEQEGIKKAFINARIIEESGKEWGYEEGCLSIPEIRGEVFRQPKVTIRYMDEDFNEHTETYDGMNARVIQHEYDHIDGILFTEHLSGLKKRMLKRRLEKIRRGDISPDYRMKFTNPKRR